MKQLIQLNAAINEELQALRLDQALAKLFPEYSREQHKYWIKNSAVKVNDIICNQPRYKTQLNDQIEITAELEDQGEWQAQDIPLDIIFEDDDIIVINKHAGLVVHPGAGNPDKTLVNALLHHQPDLIKLPRAGIVHRLDKNTSGLLVSAKNLTAQQKLIKALSKHDVKREYHTLVHGELIAGGSVEQPIGRHPKDRIKMAINAGGKPAVTHYRIIEKFAKATYLRVNLETGRTHQIRVHMQAIRHPIIGDPMYGIANKTVLDKAIDRQALHAKKLGFYHPSSGEWLEFESELPADFNQLLAFVSSA